MTKPNTFVKNLKNINKSINSLLERNLNKLKFDNLKIVASNNKFILTFVALFFLFVSYLLVPTFYKQGDISKELRTDRLKTPRVKVPEGSVGITEQFSNIYTFESPGGWNIIGKTPYKIFNSNNKANPVLINPGDNVHFFPISKNEFLKLDEK